MNIVVVSNNYYFLLLKFFTKIPNSIESLRSP
nr:MAG TPA: hypothetical protein [Caudoviricetes sp.]